MRPAEGATARGRRARLRAEFVLLYLVAPVAMAVALPPSALFPALFVLTALGIALLHATPGFAWRRLWQGGIVPAEAAALAAVTGAVSWAVMQATAPGQMFLLWRMRPELLAAVIVLYPFLSALPQEVVFRALYFGRYGAILPGGRIALMLNAAVFALAHLMFWNWIVLVMSFAGGLVFAHAWTVRRSFPQAVLLHAVAGWVLFTFGMGMFFYSGNIVRPF
jgi:membrane protease YdiL (CAAX protease family)